MPKKLPKKYNKNNNKKNIIIAQILCLFLFSLLLGFCADDTKSNNKIKQNDTLTFLETKIEAAVGDPMITDQIASGGNGMGSITYASDNTNVATVNANSGTVTIVGAGSITITATRASDANYNTVTAMYTLTVITLMPITTIAELKNISNNLDGDYALAANIDLSGEANWTPIGTRTAKFTGSLDGRAYEITGLNSLDHRYAGLFGFMAGAKIKNLRVMVSTISASSRYSQSAAAGLVARAENSSIRNSYVTVEGNISTSNSNPYAGGLVGRIDSSSISNSYAVLNGNISASGSFPFAGGLLGFAKDSSIINSYADISGNISASFGATTYVGGLIGRAEYSPISNSYADINGNILASAAENAYAGGLVGYVEHGSINNSYVIVSNNISASASLTFAGGLVARSFMNPISNSYVILEGDISSTAPLSRAGGLIGVTQNNSPVSNSYYRARRLSSENAGAFTNLIMIGTSQTLMQLRALNATDTSWSAFYDASAGHALITDNTATFTTGDRYLWYFGDTQQLPILNPSPKYVADVDLALHRARQHFRATSISTSQINLSWSDVDDAYTYYEVYRHTANDRSAAMKIASPLVSSGRAYMDMTGLTTMTSYYYWLKACQGTVGSGTCSDFFANTQATTK